MAVRSRRSAATASSDADGPRTRSASIDLSRGHVGLTLSNHDLGVVLDAVEPGDLAHRGGPPRRRRAADRRQGPRARSDRRQPDAAVRRHGGRTRGGAPPGGGKGLGMTALWTSQAADAATGGSSSAPWTASGVFWRARSVSWFVGQLVRGWSVIGSVGLSVGPWVSWSVCQSVGRSVQSVGRSVGQS